MTTLTDPTASPLRLTTLAAPDSLPSVPLFTDDRDGEVDDHHEDVVPPMALSTRIANLIVILGPFVGLAAGMVYAWGWGLGWTELSLLFGMYILTGLGITVGYHRFFTHKSFSAGPVVTTVLGILGSMAVEGSIIRWASCHRSHHHHSDHELDPHSPHGHGHGFWGVIKGFYMAHMGWIIRGDRELLDRYTPDLRKNPLILWLSNKFPLWIVLSLAVPALIGGLIDMSWRGAFLGLLWGGIIRIGMVHHITWSVNSVCHLWGTRPFKSHDHSRNNPIVGVLALGEGWHNNHHAFPTSARHGLRWWQFDLSYIVIWVMARLGLVWNVRVPAAERQESRRRA
jgi:stearoyl-CoA desaturase (delta-9 desaturase)